MRKKTFAGRLLLFALFFLGSSNLMKAHSQNALYASYSQANINMANQTIGDFQKDQARAISSLLAEARKIFDVDFIYGSRILPGTRLIMDVDKYKTVEEFLGELLRPYNLKYKKVLAKAYVIYSSSAELKRLISALNQQNGDVSQDSGHTGAAARAIPITGRIVDAKGIPLEGVSITVKGSNRGTLTDQNGLFKIQIDNENAVLVFSLVGYATREMPVGGRTDFQVSMVAQTQSLDDVVVVGYGTQKKSVVTGAISSVKSSDLEDQPVQRVEDALQGRTTGVTIAASSGPEASDSGHYLQLAAFRVRSGAEGFLQHLTRELDPALATRLRITNSESFFRVQLGPYAQRSEAEGAALRLRDDLGLASMIVAPH